MRCGRSPRLSPTARPRRPPGWGWRRRQPDAPPSIIPASIEARALAPWRRLRRLAEQARRHAPVLNRANLPVLRSRLPSAPIVAATRIGDHRTPPKQAAASACLNDLTGDDPRFRRFAADTPRARRVSVTALTEIRRARRTACWRRPTTCRSNSLKFVPATVNLLCCSSRPQTGRATGRVSPSR